MGSNVSFYNTTGPTYQGENPASSSNDGELIVVIDGGGSPIGTGVVADIPVSFDCTINSVTIVTDVVGSIVVDVWKASLANFPPTSANSITASDPPTISDAQTFQDTTLTRWTTTVANGDILRVNVNSAATCTRATLTFKITKG